MGRSHLGLMDYPIMVDESPASRGVPSEGRHTPLRRRSSADEEPMSAAVIVLESARSTERDLVLGVVSSQVSTDSRTLRFRSTTLALINRQIVLLGGYPHVFTALKDLLDLRRNNSQRDEMIVSNLGIQDIFELESMLIRELPEELLGKALEQAIRIGGSPGSVGLLLTLRVDPCAWDDTPDCLVVSAAGRGRSEELRLLLQHPDVNAAVQNNEALRTAAAGGHMDCLAQLLVREEVNVDDPLNPALPHAAYADQERAVTMLLASSAGNNLFGVRVASNSIQLPHRGGHTHMRLLRHLCTAQYCFATEDRDAIEGRRSAVFEYAHQQGRNRRLSTENDDNQSAGSSYMEVNQTRRDQRRTERGETQRRQDTPHPQRRSDEEQSEGDANSINNGFKNVGR